MTSVVLAVNAVFFHGNPGFYEDSLNLRNSLGSQYQWSDGENIQNNSSVDLAVGYSYGAYSLLKALEEKKLSAKTIVLIAPFIKSDTPLSFMALTLLKIPFVRKRIVAKSWTKWKEELVAKMFSPQELETPSVSAYLKRIDQEEIWNNVILAKLKQENSPAHNISESVKNIIVIAAGEDKTSPLKKVRQDLCDLSLNQVQTIELANASHGIIFTQYNLIAQKIKEFIP